MDHLLAYSASIATGVETDLTPVADSIISIQNGHFLPQRTLRIRWAAAMATNLQRARIITPTLRQYTTPFIRGIMAGLVPTSPNQVATYAMNPLDLKISEEVQVNAFQNAAGAQRVTVLLGCEVQPSPPASGNMYMLRGTSTTAAVANAWSLLTVTWADVLPQGQYAVVGLQAVSTNAQAARLIFEGQPWRPGALSSALISDFGHPYFVNGALGQWGMFSQYAMPNVEVLCNAADASHEIYLGIMPL